MMQLFVLQRKKVRERQNGRASSKLGYRSSIEILREQRGILQKRELRRLYVLRSSTLWDGRTVA